MTIFFHCTILKSLRYTYIVQSCLADRIIFDAQHFDHLLHFAEDLSQRDVLWLQLVLNLCVVPLLMRKNTQKFTVLTASKASSKYTHMYTSFCQHCTKTPCESFLRLWKNIVLYITIQTDNIIVLVCYGHLFWRNLSWCTANMKYQHFQSNSCPYTLPLGWLQENSCWKTVSLPWR